MASFSYEWLAGIIDGEGSFTISIFHRVSSSGRPNITFNPRIVVGLTGDEAWVLDMIQKETGLGRLYDSNKGHPKLWHKRWQTTDIADSVELAKRVLPYLVIKKTIAERFLIACEILLVKSKIGVNKYRGERKYDLATVMSVAEIATSLNPRRSKLRYNDYKDMNHWTPILKDIYS